MNQSTKKTPEEIIENIEQYLFYIPVILIIPLFLTIFFLNHFFANIVNFSLSIFLFFLAWSCLSGLLVLIYFKTKLYSFFKKTSKKIYFWGINVKNNLPNWFKKLLRKLSKFIWVFLAWLFLILYIIVIYILP